MTENLNVNTYRNGDTIPQVQDPKSVEQSDNRGLGVIMEEKQKPVLNMGSCIIGMQLTRSQRTGT
jgi:hypothetical protein